MTTWNLTCEGGGVESLAISLVFGFFERCVFILSTLYGANDSLDDCSSLYK